jgi:hypothetical protein
LIISLLQEVVGVVHMQQVEVVLVVLGPLQEFLQLLLVRHIQ